MACVAADVVALKAVDTVALEDIAAEEALLVLNVVNTCTLKELDIVDVIALEVLDIVVKMLDEVTIVEDGTLDDVDGATLDDDEATLDELDNVEEIALEELDDVDGATLDELDNVEEIALDELTTVDVDDTIVDVGQVGKLQVQLEPLGLQEPELGPVQLDQERAQTCVTDWNDTYLE